jgi:periplasmic divalent cation tolerance protein
MSDTHVVLVTAPDAEAAIDLTRKLLAEGLVACGNVLPGVTSVYRWEEEVHEDSEVLLVLKTHRSRLDELVRRVPELHPYDVPEVLALEVTAGHPAYLGWVAEECRPRGRS